jgi:hypothetical protein
LLALCQRHSGGRSEWRNDDRSAVHDPAIVDRACATATAI